ncbi:hypothetical protein PR003_g5209 [Phytophthora rubi]|uniref:Uncharacterized protein n=1 Tax=Phytophthora rubi TaxID=129364 RepID=A0A6A4FTI3_9STRA|nr:hypothetical protein PR003_g5209 [Phytophthora rubi]
MEVKELEEKPAAQLATDLSVPAGGIKMVAPGETQRFPAFLPMQHPYEREKFFVRECYPIYYDLIMDKLYTKDKRCVVITGAPGTGKSLFYAYFFERFRQEEERQNFTIVTAAFASESKLTKVVAFKGKQNEPIGTSEWPLSSEFNESIWQVDGANTIRLYDGPPFVETPYPLKMVCFTSPKENWLYRFVKDTTVRTLCMPVWTPDELWRAATRLGYNSLSPPLTRAMIDDRFTNFGGVARECLELTEEVVQTRLELFEAVIKEMSPEVATIMLKGDSAYNGRPRLCHLVPVRDDPWHFEVQIASEGISLKLLEKISTAEFEDRSKLIRCLRGISEEAASRGYLFELKVHELLVRGISIDTILLRDGRGDQQPIRQITFHCEKSNDFNFFEPKTLSKATLSSGPYHIPGVSNFESVDSFYYPYRGGGLFSFKRTRLLLFQMTVASRQPSERERYRGCA